jgi:hypothetical protein
MKTLWGRIGGTLAVGLGIVVACTNPTGLQTTSLDAGGSPVDSAIPDGTSEDAPTSEASAMEAGPTIPDSSCVNLRTLELGGAYPSAVAMHFSVENCSGQPLPAIDPTRFEVLEDGQPLVTGASVTNLALKGDEAFVELIVDLSNQTRPYLTNLVAAAKTTVDILAGHNRRVQFGVYAFDGSQYSLAQDPASLSVDQTKARLDALLTLETRDKNSANLNAGLIEAMALQKSDSDEFRRRNGAFTPRYALTFTGGRDTSQRATIADVTRATTSNSVELVAITVSDGRSASEIEASLKHVGPRGVFVASSGADLSRVATDVAQRVRGRMTSNYLLGYCSAARAGEHQVAVRLKAPTDTRLSATGLFRADGFGAGCSASVLTDCAGKACGGLSCGSCDERTSACTATASGGTECKSSCDIACGELQPHTITNPRGYAVRCPASPTRVSCYENGWRCVDSTSEPSNCGGCRKECGRVGATCTASTCNCGTEACPTSVDLETPAKPFYADATHLYLSDPQFGVYRIPLGGGAREVISTSIITRVPRVYGTEVFWRDEFNNVQYVYRMSLAPGAAPPQIVLALPAGGLDSYLGEFTVDSSNIYFVVGNTIRRQPIAGGTAVELVNTVAVGDLSVDGGYLYFATTAYADFFARVQRLPLGGGAPEEIMKESGSVSFGPFSRRGPLTFLRQSLDTGDHSLHRYEAGSVRLFHANIPVAQRGYPYDFDALGAMYWVASDGSVYRSQTGVGADVALSTMQTGLIESKVVVGGNRVFWSTTAGYLRSVPK